TVEHQHRDVLFDGRKNGGGMEDLGAEVGQLRGFLEADDFHPQRVGANARVGAHDAVDVGPDFDGFGSQRATDESAGKVGTAAAQGGGDSRFIGGDEAAHDGNLGGVDQWTNL